MNRKEIVDCFEFYLWSVGELQLNPEPALKEFTIDKEEL